MNPVHSFLKCLLIMSLSLTSKDVSKYKSKFQNSLQEAEPFLKKHSFLRDMKKEAKVVIDNNLECYEVDAAELAALLKDVMPSLTDDISIPAAELKLIKDIALFMRKDSEPAWQRIKNNVTIVKDPSLSFMFMDGDETSNAATHGDTKLADEMAVIVKKLTGRSNDPVLTLDEIQGFRISDPKYIEKYAILRKEFAAKYRATLLRFVRSSNKDLVDAQQAAKYLTGMGCNYIPKGFVGNIDEKGRLHTTTGKLIKGMLIGEVVMNPKYDPELDNTYVCYLKSNRANRLRTDNFVSGNKAATFNKVSEFADNVDSHRKKWVADLKSLDEKTATIAAMVETIYEVQARIGGDSKNKDNEERFGMSTVQMKHIKIMTDGVHFKYPGKKGTVQTHVLRANNNVSRQVIAIIKKITRNKTADDLVFTYQGAGLHAQAVNKYLKSIGVNVTIHKFRHLAGTKLAKEILGESPFKKSDKPSQASVDKWIKEALKDVGEMLHHRTGSGEKQKTTAMTAINSYVDPSLMRGFYANLGLRTPTWVPKA